MTNKNYVSGRRFEYEIMAVFQKGGYDTFRTAGSHGVVDVICVGENDVILIQCKKQKKNTSYAKDIEKLRAVKTHSSVLKLLAVKQQGMVTLQNVNTGKSITKKMKELQEWLD